MLGHDVADGASLRHVGAPVFLLCISASFLLPSEATKSLRVQKKLAQCYHTHLLSPSNSAIALIVELFCDLRRVGDHHILERRDYAFG